MTRLQRVLGRRFGGAAAGLLGVLLALGAGAAPPPARAAVPGTPAFSSPLDVTNPFLPFVPGAVKVYGGVEHGVPTMTVETHRGETRDFSWGGGTVACRVIETIDFRRGVQSGRERLFVAQADDGSVWTFGEVEDDDAQDGEDQDEPGGWVVGTRGPSDSAGVLEGGTPMLLVPANPELRDEWQSEDLPPHLDSTLRVVGAGETLRVAGRRLEGCVRLREQDRVDVDEELRWLAPGLGLVRARARGESLALRASTIRAGL